MLAKQSGYKSYDRGGGCNHMRLPKLKSDKKMTAKRVALSGLFLALALIVSLIENALPPIIPALPYAKIGLGNIVLLACFLMLGAFEGYVVLILRCFLNAVFAGNIASMAWSLPSALVAYTVMILLCKSRFFSICGVSVVGGIMHNLVQILVSMILVGNSVLVYLPYMMLAGALAGFVTGIVCYLIIKALRGKITLVKEEVYIRET